MMKMVSDFSQKKRKERKVRKIRVESNININYFSSKNLYKILAGLDS